MAYEFLKKLCISEKGKELEKILDQIPDQDRKDQYFYEYISEQWKAMSKMKEMQDFMFDADKNLKVNVSEIPILDINPIDIESENENLKYYITSVYTGDVSTHEINLNFIANQIYVSFHVASGMDRHIFIANKDRPVNENCSINDPNYTHYKYKDILCPASTYDSYVIDMEDFEGMNYFLDGGDGYAQYRFFFFNKKISKISNLIYSDFWNDIKNIAPSKNAIYDKIESLSYTKSTSFQYTGNGNERSFNLEVDIQYVSVLHGGNYAFMFTTKEFSNGGWKDMYITVAQHGTNIDIKIDGTTVYLKNNANDNGIAYYVFAIMM
ncbi:hypothetical protein ES702_06201 [subsurface metagenome]